MVCERTNERSEPPESPIPARTMKEGRQALPFFTMGETGSSVQGEMQTSLCESVRG